MSQIEMATADDFIIAEKKSPGANKEESEHLKSVGVEPGQGRSNGAEEAKVPIDSENEDGYAGEEAWKAEEEDSIRKPLAMQYYGYPDAKKVVGNMEGLVETRSSRLKDVILTQLWQPKKREWRLVLFVLFLFIVIIVGLIVIYQLHREDHYYIYHKNNITLHKNELRVNFRNSSGGGRVILSGVLWRNSAARGKPFDCSTDQRDDDDGSLCLLWRKDRRLEIDHFETDHGFCSRIQWHFLTPETSKNSDCFDLGEGVRWFGAGILKNSSGTLETVSISRQPFVTDRLDDSAGGAFGPVVERLFLNSEGVAVVVEANSSVELSINDIDGNLNSVDKQLCLHTTTTQPVHSAPISRLSYLVCTAQSVIEVREDVLSLLVSNPGPKVPHRDILSSPIWSTWGYFKEQYNDSSLMLFADRIAEKFKGGRMLMIDDGWEEETGDLEFMTSKFTHPKAMIDALHAKHFHVSLGFRAQLSTSSVAFRNTTIQRHLVQSFGDEVPALRRWWNGPRESKWERGLTGVYDLTDDEEVEEMLMERLLVLQGAYGVDVFHIGGTEASSLPLYSVTKSRVADENEFTRRGVEFVSNFGPLASAEAASRSQNFSAMIRLKGGTSTWNGVGGLQSVIPAALSLGLLGYPLFISDSVGGSAYDGYPTKELFLRWLHVSAFLPTMHLSIPPWLYDEETETAVKNILSVRETLVLPEIHSILRESSNLLHSPIVRPVWWLDPKDNEALGIVDEFLVGSNILVAPVLDEGRVQRDIYLPRGLWRDPLLGVNHSGQRWLHGYAVNLTSVAYFIRQ